MKDIQTRVKDILVYAVHILRSELGKGAGGRAVRQMDFYLVECLSSRFTVGLRRH